MLIHTDPALAPNDDIAPPAPRRVLAPGRNCWRIERTRRLAFLVDGASYFPVLRRAIANARHSVLILSWDIDSRMRLVPEGANDGLPEPLGEFLDACVRRRRSLRVHMLAWDYAMLFALEREWLQDVRLDLNTHRRLRFHLDDNHPIGASHHQKIVVIDDRLAFIGGLDLTRARWDTSAHREDEPLRRDPDGKPYAPFHDVQVMLDGDAARALGELARERWRRATGRRPRRPPAKLAHDPWPEGIEPEIRDLHVAIARTEPAYDGREGVHEVRNLFVDGIASARHTLFFEQQYFTSSAIGDALAKRLQAPAPPEVAVVMARAQCGWLEDNTMGVMRARVDRVLREVDPTQRYRMYAACGGADRTRCLNIHSKIMVVDDALLVIGSANASNRSLGFDTEASLAIEANGDVRIEGLIASLRDRLIAEHTGTDVATIAAVTRAEGLHAAIEKHASDDRALVPFEPRGVSTLEAIVPEALVIDPERPMLPEQLAGELIDHTVRPTVRRRLVTYGALALAIAVMVAMWRITPLREYVSLTRIVAQLESLGREPHAPLAMLGAYLFAGATAFPIVVLMVATALMFSIGLALPLALVGGIASAAVGFGIGRAIGSENARRLFGARAKRLRQRLPKRGLLATMLARIVPIAPFAVVNVIAGTTTVTWREFLLGTLAGLLPGLTMLLLFIDSAVLALREPGPDTLAVMALLAAVLVAVSAFLANRIGRAVAKP